MSVRLACAAGVLVVAACSGSDGTVDDSLRRDLELAATETPITLANAESGAEVVSAIERTAPAPRRPAPSRRAVKYTPAPRAEPAPVEVEQAAVSEELEAGRVDIIEVPVEVATLPSPRPQPVTPSGVGDVSSDGGGGSIGDVIGVVLRGGRVGIDKCERHDGGDRRGTIAINNRIPVVGTFPGRIQGTFPGSGRIQASLPRSGRGRTRF